MKKQLRIKKWSAGLLLGFCFLTLSTIVFVACKENNEVISSQEKQITLSVSYLKFEGKALNHLNAETRVIENNIDDNKNYHF
jgi:hypothetical protein